MELQRVHPSNFKFSSIEFVMTGLFLKSREVRAQQSIFEFPAQIDFTGLIKIIRRALLSSNNSTTMKYIHSREELAVPEGVKVTIKSRIVS
jgi:hypothetical protein